MLIKELVYNNVIIRLFDNGIVAIFTIKNKRHIVPEISVGDIPIINELMKDLVEEFVNWKRKQ